MSARASSFAARVGLPIYKHYFRVESHGVERVPKLGAAIIVANHSGTLPFDATMLWMDSYHRLGRVLRPIADHFASTLPFFSIMMQRVGAVGGTSTNARALLEAGEALLIFPEGVPGISKPRQDKYKLTRWRPGHVELALRHHVPVIPVAVIGAEEQLPVLLNSERLGRLFGVPHVPIPMVPFPLPVKYHLHYGHPIHFPRSADGDDPQVVRAACEKTRAAVEALIAFGLSARKGVFR